MKKIYLILCLSCLCFIQAEATCLRRARFLDQYPEDAREAADNPFRIEIAKELLFCLLENPLAEAVKYHGRMHAETLAEFAQAVASRIQSRGMANAPDFVELVVIAAWLHDAGYYLEGEYGTLSISHEELSQYYVARHSRELGLDSKSVQMVNYMIKGTDLAVPADIIMIRHGVIEKLIEGEKLDDLDIVIKEELIGLFSEFDFENIEHLEMIRAASYGAMILGTGDIGGFERNYVGRIAGLRAEFKFDVSALEEYLSNSGVSSQDLEDIENISDPDEAFIFLINKGYDLAVALAGERLACIPLAKSTLRQIAETVLFYQSVVNPRLERFKLIENGLVDEEYLKISSHNRRLVELVYSKIQAGVDDDQIIAELLSLAREFGMDISNLSISE
ncbi:MAG: hypothetical protein PHQ54_05070 [Candidatus Omnitrophica bacterium]|nr:hypothetical protein [Candidatus Omnitrophota bacterium]